jgi:hypothetical protein
MEDAERRERLVARLEEERDVGGPGYWYLGFADPDRPEGQRFVGGCVVKAVGFVHALMESHVHGCNPGGSAQGYNIPPFPDSVLNPLLTRAELSEAGIID